MEKVLIMSVKAGYGHHSTGQAIKDYFNKNNIECEMLDVFGYISSFLGESINDGYMMLTKYLPEIYGGVYGKLAKNTKEKEHSPIVATGKMVANKIKEYVLNYDADVVIGTHSYACMLMSYLKKKEIITCPTYGVITDFMFHPLWENAKLDYYVTPDKLLNNQAMKKGIPEDKILPFGIPIKEKFSVKIDKAEARKMLNIEDKPTVLVMMGSMGFGNIDAEIERIMMVESDFQILCVCGTNEKMKSSLQEMEWKKDIYIYGFVDNIDVMMDASDLIITKPGGLTTSELMAKGLPALYVNPIPGQEDRNMEFLVNCGAGMMINKEFTLDEALYQVMNNPWRCEVMKKSIEYLGKPYATRDLCEFIMKNERDAY